jgi:hypothetical protein
LRAVNESVLRDLSAGALGDCAAIATSCKLTTPVSPPQDHASAASLSEAINKIGAKNRVDAARIARVKGWL